MQSTLQSEQFIPASIDEVWDFFSSPRNLDALTPADLKFHIVTEDLGKMHAGQLIEYRISVFPGIWMKWLTEIRHVRDGEYFVDEQRFGPYQFWYHEHRFVPVAGGIRMTDHVTYRVGYGPFGWLAHKLFIRRMLKKIFAYRAEAVARFFPSSTAEKPIPAERSAMPAIR